MAPIDFHLDANVIREDIAESLQLLKSSVMITEEKKIFLLDPEQYSEEFKTKVYGLLKKGNLREGLGKVTSGAELFGTDNNAAELKAAGVLEATDVREDLLPDLKSLKADEKAYIVHLTCVHLQLAHQRNQLLHWFYIPAMAALAGRSCKESVSEGMCVLGVVLVMPDGNCCGYGMMMVMVG